MNKKIFYSWQSDLPNNINRTLIGDAAEKAAATIRNDGSLEVEPVVVRDTQGHAGCPNIADTIMSQIDTADIFLADITFIGKANGRLIPNPNVLIELGYALKKLGKDKIILVMNTSKGGPDNLPFDLKMSRVTTYSATPETITTAKNSLRNSLQTAFEMILSRTGPVDSEEADKLIEYMAESKPGRLPAARHFSENIFKLLESKKPNYDNLADGEFADDRLVSSLDTTKEIVDNFANIASEAACCNDFDVLKELGRIFELLADKYYAPVQNNVIASSDGRETAYYHILSYELYILYLAPLLRENKFSLLKKIIENPMRLSHNSRGHSDEVNFEYLAEYSPLMEIRQRRLKRVSAIADWMRNRREVGSVGETSVTWKVIAETDRLLHFYCTSLNEPNKFTRHVWPPYTSVYSSYDTPIYILSARKKKVAEELIKLFNLSNLDDLKRLIQEGAENESKMFDLFHAAAIDAEDINLLGSI